MTDNKRYNMWQVEMVVPLEDLPVFESALEEYFDVLLMSEIEKGENAGKWKVGAINNGEIDEAKLSTLVSLASIATGIDEPKIEVSVKESGTVKEKITAKKLPADKTSTSPAIALAKISKNAADFLFDYLRIGRHNSGIHIALQCDLVTNLLARQVDINRPVQTDSIAAGVGNIL